MDCFGVQSVDRAISLLIINDYWWRDIFLIEILVLVYIGFLHRIQI
jgi:hypothetical protein